MKALRLLSAVLFLLFSLPLLCACADEHTPPLQTTTAATETTTETPTETATQSVEPASPPAVTSRTPDPNAPTDIAMDRTHSFVANYRLSNRDTIYYYATRYANGKRAGHSGASIDLTTGEQAFLSPYNLPCEHDPDVVCGCFAGIPVIKNGTAQNEDWFFLQTFFPWEASEAFFGINSLDYLRTSYHIPTGALITTLNYGEQKTSTFVPLLIEGDDIYYIFYETTKPPAQIKIQSILYRYNTETQAHTEICQFEGTVLLKMLDQNRIYFARVIDGTQVYYSMTVHASDLREETTFKLRDITHIHRNIAYTLNEDKQLVANDLATGEVTVITSHRIPYQAYTVADGYVYYIEKADYAELCDQYNSYNSVERYLDPAIDQLCRSIINQLYAADMTIWRANLDGSAPVKLVTLPNLTLISMIVEDNVCYAEYNLYDPESGSLVESNPSPALCRIDLTTGTWEMLN